MAQKVSCTVEDSRVTIYVAGGDENLSHEKGDEIAAVRRHILGQGLGATIKIIYKYILL